MACICYAQTSDLDNPRIVQMGLHAQRSNPRFAQTILYVPLNVRSAGGSEKFDQKRDYFMQELLSHHRRTARAMLDVNVARTGLLDSVSAA